MKKTIALYPIVGEFAEDKDSAASIRKNSIESALGAGNTVQLDFSGIGLVTQSFVHALISNVLRSGGEKILGSIDFKGCVPGVRGIIETVVQYSLDTGNVEEDFTPDETDARVETILKGAFKGPPKSLQEIPKKNGQPRKKRKTLHPKVKR